MPAKSNNGKKLLGSFTGSMKKMIHRDSRNGCLVTSADVSLFRYAFHMWQMRVDAEVATMMVRVIRDKRSCLLADGSSIADS